VHDLARVQRLCVRRPDDIPDRVLPRSPAALHFAYAVLLAACGQPFVAGTTGGSGGASSASTPASSSATTASASTTTSASTSSASTGTGAGGMAASCVGQTGCVQELAGMYQDTGTSDGAGVAARFTKITGITGDGADTLWVTDDKSIRSVTISTGKVSTLAVAPGTLGELRGIVYVAPSPNSGMSPFLLVSDATHHVVRRVDPSDPSNADVFSGTLDTQGSMDGTPATYEGPGALAWVAGSGRYFVIDGDAVRYFFNGGNASTVPPPSASNFKGPGGLVVAPTAAGATYTLIVGETAGDDLLSFTAPSGQVMPWTAGPTCGANAGFHDGTCGVAPAPQFSRPQGLAWRDASLSTFFVADTQNNRVRQVVWPGVVDTVAGDGKAGHQPGVETAAEIDAPTAVYFRATANEKDLFIVDAAGTEILRESLP
jgi:sugar lactone lactonase YvrE